MEDSNVMELMEATERLEAVADGAGAGGVEAGGAAGGVGGGGGRARGADRGDGGDGARGRAGAEAARGGGEDCGADGSWRPCAIGRKTLAAGMATHAGQARCGAGVGCFGWIDRCGVLDGALASLSMEQRIAVKAELMRAGLLG